MRSGQFADQVFIEQLEISCIIGILPHERLEKQPLIVDVAFDLDIARAAKSGSLERSLDYVQAATLIKTTLEMRQFELLETAAEVLCKELLHLGQNVPVNAVTLSLRKPKALGYGAIAGVKMRREG